MTRLQHIDFSKLSKAEKKMIAEIVAMKKRTINKLMVPTHEIVAFAHDTKLEDAISVFEQHHFSRYPVYYKDIDHIVGVLFIKDIVSFWKDCKDQAVVDFVRFPHFIYEDRSALDVFFELQKLRLSIGVVIDEFGSVAGIVMIEDLIEEVVGDIEDEFDRRKKPFVEALSDNEFVVNTRMELNDFSEYFSVPVDEDDVSTVGGLVVKAADRIPKVGEEIVYKNLKFTILEGTRRKINKVKVKKQ